MRVATFNMLSHGYTKYQTQDGQVETEEQQRRREERNGVLIQKLDADVLFLQEHDRDLSIEGYPFSARAFVGKWEGCSVLFRKPPAVALHTRTVGIGYGKSAAIADMDGTVFASVHLKGGPDTKDARKMQVAMLLHALPPTGPCIIAGDMNDTAPEETFGDLLGAAGFKRTAYDGFSGFSSDLNTPLAIDHMFARGVTLQDVHIPFAVENPWIAESTSGSDHAAVVGTVVV
jgi:endonuclease/exonuclease/phosphatase family metal-dependent hydrolase